jgi:hypothetical protein
MRFAICAFPMIVLAAPALAAPLVDEVDNGGFEAFNGTSPADWAVLSGNVAPSQNADTGSLAVVMNPGSGTTASIAQAVPNDGDDLPIVAGTWYEFDFAAQLGLGAGSSATADGVVHWLDATGAEVRADRLNIAQSGLYLSYSAVLQAPLPSADHPVPVTSAVLTFTLQRSSPVDRHDVLVFVDAVAFGPTTPPLPV